MHKEISSLKHPLIRHIVLLRTDSNYRKEARLIVVEGIKAVREIAENQIIQVISCHNDWINNLTCQEKFLVTPSVLQKMSGMMNPEGILAVVKMPSWVELGNECRVLALDGVSDPGNLGTLMRTALAFGWKTLFFLPGCCDPYNDKVIRSAKGAHFHLQMVKGNHHELHQWIQNHQAHALVADLSGQDPAEMIISGKQVLILGNEANGPSSEVYSFSKPVSLAMSHQVESLNVAIAGGVLMYMLRKQ